MFGARWSEGRGSGEGIRAWLALPAPHDRFPCLDGMRALAALSIFVYHGFRRTSYRFTDAGLTLEHLDVGVAVFFVISGFLIYRPFVAANLAGRPAPRLRSYFRRRAFRVYPAYIVAILVFWRLDLIGIDGPVGLLKHLTLTSRLFRDGGGAGLAVAWTLTVEVSFYVFVPLWAAITRTVGRRLGNLGTELLGAVVLVGLGTGSIWWFYPDSAASPGMRIVPQAFSTLGVGMLFAILSAQGDRDPRLADVLRRVGDRAWAWWALGIGAFVVRRWLAPVPVAFVPVITPRMVAARAWQLPVALGLMLPMIFGDQGRGVIRRVMRSRPAVFFGTVSYGLYLWHYPIIETLTERPVFMGPFRRQLVPVTVAFVLSMAAAVGSWYLVERPCLRIGRGGPRGHRRRAGSRRSAPEGAAAVAAPGPSPASTPAPGPSPASTPAPGVELTGP